MAETLGSLYDKYTIAGIRAHAVSRAVRNANDSDEANEFEKLLDNVLKQKEDLKQEIADFTELAKRGKVKLQEPKYKLYKNENPSGRTYKSIEAAVLDLEETNQTLWSLEDQRRDKEKSDAEIRRICDDVAKFNRVRNDIMDEINKLFAEALASRKTQ